MLTSGLIFIPALVFMLVLLFEAGKAAFIAIHSYFKFKPVSVTSLPLETTPMPDALEEMDLALQLEGFKPPGVLEVKLMIGSGHEWVYRSEDGTIYAGTVKISDTEPAMVQFASIFPNKAMLITRYPKGERILTPTYQSRFAAHSMETALEYHRWKVEQWRSLHGDPLLTRKLEDTQRYDNVFRDRYRRRDNQRLTTMFAILSGLHLLTALSFAWGALMVTGHTASVSLVPTVSFLGSLFLTWVVTKHVSDETSNPARAVDGAQVKKKKRNE